MSELSNRDLPHPQTTYAIEPRAALPPIGDHVVALRRFLRKLRPRDLDDLVQDALLASLESRGRFRGDAAFATYLFQIARNMLRAQRRAQLRQGALIENTAELESDVPHDAADEELEPNTARLLAALADLPADLERVVTMIYFEGLTQEQAARHLSVPAGTVASRLRRARDHLRHTLRQSESG